MQPTVVRVCAVRTCGIVKVRLHSFLTSALDEGEWLAFATAALPPGKQPPSRCTLNRSVDGPYLENRKISFVTPDFRGEVDEIHALLGCYAASSGNSIATFGATYRSYLQGSRHLEEVVPKRRQGIATNRCVI